MKRGRDEDNDLESVISKLRRMEPSRKRGRDDETVERSIRRRVEGEFKFDIVEYRKMILSLYHQNIRMMKRATDAENRVVELESFVHRFIAFKTVPDQTVSQYCPTLVK
jgi:hypothetical protein